MTITQLPPPSSDDTGSPEPAPAAPVVVAVQRRTIDAVLIGIGAAVAAVLLIAGGLLTWGNDFSEDYVRDELSSQNIFFPERAALEEEGRTDLLDFAGQQVTTGDQAEAYASYIDGHLAGIADGATYAELGAVEREAKAAVTAATEAGASPDEVAALQATADEFTNQRNTLFKGETLRGLLLSAFAWSTVGRIAGIAATVSFVFAGVMVVLVVLGVVHHRRTAKV
jgi:hypothetical protein